MICLARSLVRELRRWESNSRNRRELLPVYFLGDALRPQFLFGKQLAFLS
jgi:hypothetical protein